MKAVKYLLAGALMLSIGTAAMAQDNNAAIQAAASIIKSKPADLQDQLKDIYKKNKKNAEVLTGIGRAFYEANDSANATVYANYALKANGKYAPAYILKGDIATMSETGGGEAANQYANAIYFDPKNPDGYIKYANIYRKTSPAEAVAKLEELRAQVPGYPIEAKAAHIYFLENQFDNAIGYYAKADQSKLTDGEMAEYAMSYYFLGKNAQSLEVAKAGYNRNAKYGAFARLALFNSTDLKDYDGALTYADVLFNKCDSVEYSYMDYTYAGNAYKGKKDYAKAIEMYEKALTQEFSSKGKRAGVVKELADAYKQADDFDNALKYYKQFFDDADTHTATDYIGLAQIYVLKADAEKTDLAKRNELFKEAENVYKQLKTDMPDAEEYAIYKIAEVNTYMDPETKEGLAKPYYEQLISTIEPRAEKSNADISRLKKAYHYIAFYYMLNNDKATSDSYWNKLLEIDPENAAAKQVLGK